LVGAARDDLPGVGVTLDLGVKVVDELSKWDETKLAAAPTRAASSTVHPT
jgi:hypothetical protein